MAMLHYVTITSLDGFVEDAEGRIDWYRPDDDVAEFVNDLVRPIATYLYGRRIYETMVFWETNGTGPDDDLVEKDFANLWRRADKVVYSRTLTSTASERTRIERELDPAVLRRLKASSSTDLAIGGATLAGTAMAAGLVDELGLFVVPVAVGGGIPALPAGLATPLELLDERRFASGVVYLRYRVGGAGSSAGS